jgi:hypothetical protein
MTTLEIFLAAALLLFFILLHGVDDHDDWN